ncbi:MAG: hypothetical protein AAGD12_09080 [Pseudomonadota bacterium]
MYIPKQVLLHPPVRSYYLVCSAEAKLLRRSRNIGFAEGALRDADGVIYAHGSATCAIKQFG